MKMTEGFWQLNVTICDNEGPGSGDDRRLLALVCLFFSEVCYPLMSQGDHRLRVNIQYSEWYNPW